MRNFNRMSPKEHKNDDMERCPLAGAGKAISMIDGAVMLVIGTEECAYYTKATLSMRGSGDSCFSVVLDKQDVTFGSVDKVESAVHELLAECAPTALFLVTTCVVEIIGDDFTALAQEVATQYHIPVKIIQTNHFKGKDANYGYDLVAEAAATFGKRPNKFSMIAQKFGQKRAMKSRMGGRA